MHHQAGVRTVVTGGRPELGPMQAVGGTRGAQAYTSVDLDDDIDVAEVLNTTVANVLPDRSVGNYINFAEFNIKDAVRQGETFPLQFAFEAATCRIFYTQHTVYNYLNLWNYVVDAIWRNPSLCVDGSANGTTILPTNTTGPTTNQKEITVTDDQNLSTLILSGMSSGPQVAQPSSQPQKRQAPTPTAPNNALSSHHLSNEIDDGPINVSDCKACTTRPGYVCAQVQTCSNGKITKIASCRRACQKGGHTCQVAESCFLGSGPGFCISRSESLSIASCKTPTTKDVRAQTTKAVGGGLSHLPYGKRVGGPGLHPG